MLRSVTNMSGYRLIAEDGDVGWVDDVLVDVRDWHVRWIVVDTGEWLPGQRVLVPPHAVESVDWEEGGMHVTMTKASIRKSPPLGRDAPVSEQHERHCHEHFGWPYSPDKLVSSAWVPAVGLADGGPSDTRDAPGRHAEDPALHALSALAGCGIEARDGSIGHVEDLIAETAGPWVVRYLVVDTQDWQPGGRKVIIAPAWVNRVDWLGGIVSVDHTVDEVKESPEFDPAAPVNRDYEEHLYDYYGRPVYWDDTQA